jgi:flagellum-specific peptidoglycan hydrolase FlgJ
MSQFVYNCKIVLRTITVIFVVSFITFIVYSYNNMEADANVEAPLVIDLPDFEHNSNQQFLDDVNQCVDYIYHTTSDVFPVNRELLLAQAALESGWGTSRFAREGHNLFGMRTYDLTEPHMLPSNNPKKWGVKVYMHECDSVLHYINTLNNGTNFEKYQKLKQEGENDPFKLLQTLDGYASDKHYFSKVKKIILLIREEYEINHIK